MQFILVVVKVFLPNLFSQRYIELFTPYGRKFLQLDEGASLEIRVPDYYTKLTFKFGLREVSYPLVDLMCHPKINFAPLPVYVHFNLTRGFQNGEKHALVIGHRGSGSGERKIPPDNSVEAFEQGWQHGADWVEMDVTITSDDKVVVVHDYLIDGKPVWNLTLEEFKALKPSSPTLEEVFYKVSQDAIFLIELKYPSVEEMREQQIPSAPLRERFVERVLQIVKAHPQRKKTLTSFDPDVVLTLKELSDVDVHFSTEGLPDKFSDRRRNSFAEGIRFAEENDLQGLITDADTVEPNIIHMTALARNAGLQLILYFWRSRADWTTQLARIDCAGVNGVIVDNVRSARGVIGNNVECSFGPEHVKCARIGRNELDVDGTSNSPSHFFKDFDSLI